MSSNIQWHEGVAVVAIDGELGLRNQEQMEQEFKAIVTRMPQGVVLDFSRARFVGSLGIGMVMQLNRELKGIGAGLQIVGVQPRVRMVLDTCNLGKVIPMDKTLEEAIGILRGERVMAMAG